MYEGISGGGIVSDRLARIRQRDPVDSMTGCLEIAIRFENSIERIALNQGAGNAARVV
jgi:hypothetical protein